MPGVFVFPVWRPSGTAVCRRAHYRFLLLSEAPGEAASEEATTDIVAGAPGVDPLGATGRAVSAAPPHLFVSPESTPPPDVLQGERRLRDRQAGYFGHRRHLERRDDDKRRGQPSSRA